MSFLQAVFKYLLIATNPTLSAVLVPLNSKPAAVKLVVIVINGIGKAEPPHGVSCRRIGQHAVAVCSNFRMVFYLIILGNIYFAAFQELLTGNSIDIM